MNKAAFITLETALEETLQGRTNYWMCRPEIANAEDIQICRAVLPSGEGHNFHHHPELEEAIYVLDGTIEQWVEREHKVLGAGELAHIPRGIVHATFNAGHSDAVILAVLSPASCAGPFMIDVSEEEPWRSLR